MSASCGKASQREYLACRPSPRPTTVGCFRPSRLLVLFENRFGGRDSYHFKPELQVGPDLAPFTKVLPGFFLVGAVVKENPAANPLTFYAIHGASYTAQGHTSPVAPARQPERRTPA